jgi:hypothetical protein
MVLAGAYWSEGQYSEFVSIIENNVAAQYPMLLPARIWELSGLICNGSLDQARDLAERIPAPAYWRDFQLARIELAKQNEQGAKASLTLFNQSLKESKANGSIVTWDYVGRDLALDRLGSQEHDAWQDNTLVEKAAIPLAEHLFRAPGQCPH